MIAKISKGGDFAGLTRYLTRDGRGGILALDNLASETPEEAAGEMQIAADVSRRTKSPVMHISISYAPGEQPTDDQMREDGREVLRDLGLSENQAVMVRHHDKSHAHFHIAANRVGPGGKAVSDSKSYEKAEAALRRIETRRGLSVTKGRNASEPVTGARMAGPRSTPDPRQHAAPAGVKETLLTAPSWDSLHRELGRQGWRLETTAKDKGRAGALLIGPDGQRIAAGKIDRNATLSRLKARLDAPKPKADAGAAAPNRGHTTSPVPGFARAAGAALAKPVQRGNGKRRNDPATQIKATGRAVGQIGEALLGVAMAAGKARAGSGGITRQGQRGSSIIKTFTPGPGGLRPPRF